MANSYGRQVVLTLTNKSGGGVIAGDVVIVDTANDGAFTTTTSGQSQKSVGVAQETIANNASGRVLVSGYAALVNVPASVTRGHYVETHTVAKQATGNSSRRAGSFGQFLTGGTTPTAWLWGFPDNAGAAGETVATSTIWDAAGDLAVGSGADTAARLAKGNEGGALSVVNGALAYNAGTAFPTAATNARYFRTDLGMEFYYDGTRWVSTQLFTTAMMTGLLTSTTAVGDIRSTINATTGAITRTVAPSIYGGSNIWWVNVKIVFLVTGGTALGASHKWVGTFQGLDLNGSSTGTIATLNIDSGSSDVRRELTATAGSAQAAGTIWIVTGWTKTGTPGTLATAEVGSYRVIAT